ncbi:MAG: hypothetical protein ACRELD_09810 [Longimicrobiales bacterium]
MATSSAAAAWCRAIASDGGSLELVVMAARRELGRWDKYASPVLHVLPLTGAESGSQDPRRLFAELGLFFPCTVCGS